MNPPNPNSGVDRDDPQASDMIGVAAQQRRDLQLAMLLLEQGQHDHRRSLNEALLAHAAVQQIQSSLPAMLQSSNSSIGDPSCEIVDASIQSSTSSTELQRDYLLDLERQRQIMHRESQQQNLQMQLDTSALLQQNLGHLLAAGLIQENINAGAPSVASISNGVGSTELDRLLAAESLLRRSRLQEAVHMLQNQGILLEDALNRGASDSSSVNAASTARVLLPNDPILPHFLQSSINSCTSIVNRPIDTGLRNFGHMGLLPATTSSIDGPRVDESSTKRKSEERKIVADKEAKKLKATGRRGNVACFPLPLRKHSRKFSMKLTSFHAIWNKLENCALRKEIFRRRLARNLKREGRT